VSFGIERGVILKTIGLHGLSW